MHGRLSILLILAVTGAAWGQIRSLDDPPKLLAPTQPTRQEIERRDSLKQFALGLLCLRDDRLLEALKAFEEAGRLDPDAAAVFKAQVPLLLALERGPDAIAACKRVCDLDPDDHGSWAILARMHKAVGRDQEARTALQRGLATTGINDHPEVAQQMYLDLAGLCESAGQFAEAANAYHKAAELLDHPDRIAGQGPFDRDAILSRAAETYERIGNLYRKAKRYDQATAAYVQAQKRAPARAGRLNFNLSQLAEEQGDDRKALAYLDLYLRTQPSGMDAYERLLDLLQKLKQPADVVPWLEAAANADMHNVGLQLLLAREYGKAKQFAKGEQLYQSVAQTAPSGDLYRGLFRLYRDDPSAGMRRVLESLNKTLTKATAKDERGGAVQARAMIAALRDDGELAKGLIQVAREEGEGLTFETLHFLAALADRQRQPEDAALFYRRCLPGATRGNEALIYGGLLRVLTKARKFDEVIQVCKEGLPKADAANHLLLYSDMARALAGLERYDEALRSADRALQLASDEQKPFLRQLRVRILLMAERFEGAENECQAMLKEFTQPGAQLETRYLMSSVYAALKDYDKSEEQLQLILKADPDNAVANNDLGYVWADRNKNLPEAEAMIRRALDVDRRQRAKSTVRGDDDNASYVDSLGWVLFRRGKIDEARQELERAAKMPDGEDPVIWDHLGDVYHYLEMTDEALDAWQHGLRLYEGGKRRKSDERYRELERKVRMR